MDIKKVSTFVYVINAIQKGLPSFVRDLDFKEIEENFSNEYEKNNINAATLENILNVCFEKLKEKMVVNINWKALAHRDLVKYEIENEKIIEFFNDLRLFLSYEVDLNSKNGELMKVNTLKAFIPADYIDKLRGTGMDLSPIELQMIFESEGNLLHPPFGLKNIVREWAQDNLKLDLDMMDKDYEEACDKIRKKVAQYLKEI